MTAPKTRSKHDEPAFAGALAAYLADALPGLRGPMQVQKVAGGQSNPTFILSFPERRLVLRKQPTGELLPSAHAIDREYRIIGSLVQAGFPVPPPVLYEARPEIVGTPFYLMSYVDGRVIHETELPGLAPAERNAIYATMAATLAHLHALEWEALGLADFGRVGGHFERQIARWSRQWHLSKRRELPAVDRLIGWLARRIPPDQTTAVVHGDFRLGNLMLHPTEPRVIAVLDWELSTLGHPMADLAHNLIAWHTAPAEYGGLAGLDLAGLGIPTADEYLTLYAAGSAPGVRLEPFHLVFALFRFAVIFEGIAARSLAGNAASETAAATAHMPEALVNRAVALMDAA